MTQTGMTCFDEPIVPQNIIGSYTKKGQLMYDGRNQGGPIYAENEEELMSAAREQKDRLIREFGGFPTFLYQEPKWALRIFD